MNPSTLSTQISQMKSLSNDTQVKGKNNEFIPPLPLTNNDHPTNISTIRSLSSRIDSLVDQTNRVASGFEFNSHLPLSTQQENTSQWFDQNQK